MALQSVNEQRIVVKLYTLLGNSFSEIQEDLHDVYGDSCLSNGAFSKWMSWFKGGREATSNDKETGQKSVDFQVSW